MIVPIATSERTSNGNGLRKECTITSTAIMQQSNVIAPAEYWSATKSMLRYLNLSPDKCRVDIEMFVKGLDFLGIVILECRARALYKTCCSRDTGMDANETEIALMLHDALPLDVDVPSIYEIFSSYDLDQKGELTFRQFQECLGTPGVKSKFRLKNTSALLYLFRKHAIDKVISFPSFVKLWIDNFVELKHELRQRGVKERISKSRRLMEMFVPILKSKRRRKILIKLVMEERSGYSSKFEEAKLQIIEKRKETRLRNDEEKRSEKQNAKKRQREVIVEESRRAREKGKFLFRRRKEAVHLSRRRNATSKVQSYGIQIEKEERDAIIRNRQEKDIADTESIQNAAKDRIDLAHNGLEEVPPHLYEKREAQMKLMDVKIMDLSKNNITSLPCDSFFYFLTSMRKLALSGNNIRSLPSELDSLSSLEILLLDGNQINELPYSVSKLYALKVLDVSNNKLQAFPVDFCNLPELRVLIAHSNEIFTLPNNMGQLANLGCLDLSNNKLGLIPESTCTLRGLFSIKLSSNRLSCLPQSIGKLSNLEQLDISYNNIQELPESVVQAHKLHSLILDENKITSIPDCFGGLTNLKNLSLKRNSIQIISSKVGNMQAMNHLNCAMNGIKIIPEEIGLLTQLSYLDLKYNSIIELPKEVGALLQLQKLDLSHNNILMIPHEFCLMKTITWLDLSHNSLQELPQGFGTLTSLISLRASHNMLSKLPVTFHHLQSLEELCLASNKFHEIDCNAALPRVRVLDFEANRIRYLPLQVVEMQSLEYLNLRHNNIKSLPLEIEGRIKSVQIELGQNPLSDVPFTESFGWQEADLFQWMREERFIYKPSVDEWDVKKGAFLNGALLFDDFFNGVLWRCENLKKYQNTSLNMASILHGEVYKERMKQFFFYCKRHGNPPAYEQLGQEELNIREADSSRIYNTRFEKASIAKQEHLNRVSRNNLMYVGSLSERCTDAKRKIFNVEKQRQQMLDKENQSLLDYVKVNLEERARLDGETKAKQALDATQLAQELNQISFVSHTNKKRLLPVEHIPCWK